MSSLAKSNDFTQSVIRRLKNDQNFKCGFGYGDILIWTRLCGALTNSEIFSFLPVAFRDVWTDHSTSLLLFERGAVKVDKLAIQGLAANIVSFRRSEHHNDEIDELKNKLEQMSLQFNTLLERVTVLETENRTLRTQTKTTTPEQQPTPKAPSQDFH